uniref:Uncharacterized protein n=1 Tax=mine drainage metagenome TaxID=410659 RepID=E6QJJ8_9ZZZZ
MARLMRGKTYQNSRQSGMRLLATVLNNI